MRGRKPIPTRLKILTGKPGRGINRDEPSAPAGLPPCPPHLDTKAKTIWRRLSKQLIGLGASQVDGLALERLCSLYARIRDCERVLAWKGLTYRRVTRTGEVVGKRPEVEILAVAEKEFRALLIEFGLTPSSRSRLKVDKPPEDELDQFLKDAK